MHLIYKKKLDSHSVQVHYRISLRKRKLSLSWKKRQADLILLKQLRSQIKPKKKNEV